MTLCFLFASFFPSSQRLFRDGKLWRQMEKRENNTVRFLVNAPADFWSKRPGRPAPDYTQTEKKRKETRTRGEKKEKKREKSNYLYVFFFLSLLSVIYFENFATGGKRRIGLLGTLCDAVVSALYILSPVVYRRPGQTANRVTKLHNRRMNLEIKWIAVAVVYFRLCHAASDLFVCLRLSGRWQRQQERHKKKEDIFAFSSNKFIVGGLFNARVYTSLNFTFFYIFMTHFYWKTNKRRFVKRWNRFGWFVYTYISSDSAVKVNAVACDVQSFRKMSIVFFCGRVLHIKANMNVTKKNKQTK